MRHVLYVSNAGCIYVRPNGLPAFLSENIPAMSARFYADIHAAKAGKTATIVDTRKV